MSLHLISKTSIVAGYESGAVVMYSYVGPEGGVTDARLPSSESDGSTPRGTWKTAWVIKEHNEAGECSLVCCTLRSCSARSSPVSSDGTGGRSRSQLRPVRLRRPSRSQVRSQGDSLASISSMALHRLIPETSQDALPPGIARHQVLKIRQVGNATVSIHHSSRVCAVGGWDGS